MYWHCQNWLYTRLNYIYFHFPEYCVKFWRDRQKLFQIRYKNLIISRDSTAEFLSSDLSKPPSKMSTWGFLAFSSLGEGGRRDMFHQAFHCFSVLSSDYVLDFDLAFWNCRGVIPWLKHTEFCLSLIRNGNKIRIKKKKKSHSGYPSWDALTRKL